VGVDVVKMRALVGWATLAAPDYRKRDWIVGCDRPADLSRPARPGQMD